MFGMGMGELIIVAVVALLALGPDRLPGAAKKIGKTIRDLRRQTSNLKKTIEEDTQLGDAMKEIKQAFRDDPYREPPKRPKPKPKAKAEDEKAEDEEADAEQPEGSEESAEESAGETAEDSSEQTAEPEPAGEEASEEASDEEAGDAKPASNTVFVEPADDSVAAEPRKINMSEFQKYVHMWGPQAAAEKYGTSQEEAEAAIDAVVSQAKRDSDA